MIFPKRTESYTKNEKTQKLFAKPMTFYILPWLGFFRVGFVVAAIRLKNTPNSICILK